MTGAKADAHPHTSAHAHALLPSLPPRDPRGHKGTFGTVCIVGGCAAEPMTMLGAPALAALAALRSGAGLVRLMLPAPLLFHALALVPSCTGYAIPVDADGEYHPSSAAAVLDTAAKSAHVLAVGPGLGKGEGPRGLTLRAAQQHDVHIVFDADALNSLAEIPHLHRDFHAAAILTPHPGEFQRLAAALNIDFDIHADDASRTHAATLLAQRLACTVVLKGATTIIADPLRTHIHSSPNAALGTGGTGDTLTGIIAGLVAQFVPRLNSPAKLPSDSKPLDLFQAAILGVHIHARAAHAWCKDHAATGGMLPTELSDHIPAVMSKMAT
ncbi:hypothetical protein BH11PLA1_BH11PLA1_15320 [soil metagenome]